MVQLVQRSCLSQAMQRSFCGEGDDDNDAAYRRHHPSWGVLEGLGRSIGSHCRQLLSIPPPPLLPSPVPLSKGRDFIGERGGEERRLISSMRRKESLVSGRNKGKRRSVRQRGRVSLVLRMGYRQRTILPPLLPWRRRGGGSWRDGSWNG